MDVETLKRIDAFLAEHGQTLEAVPRARLTQFQKTDEAIQARLARIASAKETLKSCSINISAIAADSGISRKTFYNNDLLRLYVEKYAYDPEEASSSAELQRLRARIDQYKKQIDAFLLRDVETENLRHENMTLNNEISNLQKHNKNLEEQYAVILKEVQKLRSQLAVQPGHIIELPSSK